MREHLFGRGVKPFAGASAAASGSDRLLDSTQAVPLEVPAVHEDQADPLRIEREGGAEPAEPAADDEEIIGSFNFITRVANALGVELNKEYAAAFRKVDWSHVAE